MADFILEEKMIISKNNLVKNDLEDLYILFLSIIHNKDVGFLMPGAISYLNLFVLEITKYYENIKGICLDLKYKGIIQDIRGRVKEDRINFQKRSTKIEKLNQNEFNRFLGLSNKLFKNEYLKNFVSNLGVFYIENKSIGNTFLYESSLKSLVKKRDDKNFIFEYSKYLGQHLSLLSYLFNASKNNNNTIYEYNVTFRDYNVLKKKTRLFNNNINRAICLKILDMIGTINYYFLVIAKMFDENSSLRYRWAYIIWFKNYNDLTQIIEENKFLDMLIQESDFLDIIETQKKYLKKNIRDCMFHYDTKQIIKEKYYKSNQLFLGLIEQELSIDESEYIMMIDVYLKRMVNLFEKSVLK